MEGKEYVDMDIADAIMERPYGFSIDNRQFFLYPVTLGKSYLLARLIEELCIDSDVVKRNPFFEALRACNSKKEVVCRMIAYHTVNEKNKLFDETFISDRSDFFHSQLSNDELAQLLIVVLTGNNHSIFLSHLGIDKENEWKVKAIHAKNSDSSLTFGGKSVYGTLIDRACERYGWTFDYVVWGISLVNLQMLLADSITSVYLSEDERKSLRIPTDRNIVNADDPKNKELVKMVIKGKS